MGNTKHIEWQQLLVNTKPSVWWESCCASHGDSARGLEHLLHHMQWWVDHSWIPGAYQVALSLFTSAGQWGAENKMKNLGSQNKSSLIKQSKGCVEAKEKCSLFSISHQHDVQPLLGKQGFSTHRGSFKRQIWIVMALFFVLSLSFYCRPDPVWHWITLWSPTLILPIRRLLMQGGHVGVPALMLCQHCPAVPKHRCVINTFLGTTAKHSTVRAAMGRTVSGRPNTHAPLNCTLVFSKR